MEHHASSLPVVVGVDGSESSLLALRWAANQASLKHVPLDVVTAWTFPDHPAPLDIQIHEPYQDELVMQAQAKLDEIVGEVLPADQQRDVRAKVIRGDAADVLLEASNAGSLLVVGRRGCGRFKHALIGSVSERCVRRATCPVVVVH
jgi:nucleotide-binding universal stress UspA family protein